METELVPFPNATGPDARCKANRILGGGPGVRVVDICECPGFFHLINPGRQEGPKVPRTKEIKAEEVKRLARA